MDRTAGRFTTFKLQSLLDAAACPTIHSRRDLAHALNNHGHTISIHGIEAWFRHVDSNYNLERDSLSETLQSYPIPQRRWIALLDLFSLSLEDLSVTDEVFRQRCFSRTARRETITIAALFNEPAPATLVGREAVWLQVLKAYESAVNNDPKFIFLEGDAGVGKSCLMEALIEEIALTDCLILSSCCIEGSDVPLLPLLDLFERQPDQVKLTDARVVECYGMARDRVMDYRDHPSGQAFLAITSILLDLARRCSVLLMIDDLHWADESTCRFLEHLANCMSANHDLQLLFLGASRPHTTENRWVRSIEQMASHASVECVALAPFDQQETDALLRSIIKEPIDISLSQWIWSLTLGNPLFVQQVVEHLRSTQQIDTLGQVKIHTLQAPENITTTYQIRYEGLSEPTQHLLASASALGNQFDLAELQYVFGKFSTDVVVDCLEEAEEVGLLVYKNDQFLFSHPIARHSIYGLLSESRKALIHHSIGERLQSKASATSPYVFIEIAQHLLKGRMCADVASLLSTCINAARLSKQLDAWDKVIEFAQAGLELDAGELLSPSERSELLTLVGGGFHQTGDADAAIDHLMKAVDGFKAAGNELEAARALTDIFRIQTNFDKVGLGNSLKVETLESYLPMLERTDLRLAAWTMDTIASQYLHANRIERATYFTDRSISCLDHHEPCREQALVMISAGLIDLNQSRPLDAALHFSKAELIAQAVKDDASITRSHQRLAMAQLALGRCQEVIATLDSLDNYREKVTETGERSLPLSVLVSVHSLMNAFDSADTIYFEALKLIESTGYFWATPNLIAAITSSLVQQKRFDDARTAVAKLTNPNFVFEKPKSFSGLQKRLELLIADREQESSKARAIDDTIRLKPHKDGSDFSRLPAYAMGLELALRRDDQEQIAAGVDVLHEAHNRGAKFTGGWPFCIPLLLARAAFITGQPDVAADYLTLTIDLADRANAQSVLIEADGVCLDAMVSTTHLRSRIQRSLDRVRLN